jgi:predicted RNA-binding protein with RPS1 domain
MMPNDDDEFEREHPSYGLVHISQLAPERVKEVRDVLKEGDEVMVKVLEVAPEIAVPSLRH